MPLDVLPLIEPLMEPLIEHLDRCIERCEAHCVLCGITYTGHTPRVVHKNIENHWQVQESRTPSWSHLRYLLQDPVADTKFSRILEKRYRMYHTAKQKIKMIILADIFRIKTFRWMPADCQRCSHLDQTSATCWINLHNGADKNLNTRRSNVPEHRTRSRAHPNAIRSRSPKHSGWLKRTFFLIKTALNSAQESCKMQAYVVQWWTVCTTVTRSNPQTLSGEYRPPNGQNALADLPLFILPHRPVVDCTVHSGV